MGAIIELIAIGMDVCNHLLWGKLINFIGPLLSQYLLVEFVILVNIVGILSIAACCSDGRLRVEYA